MYLKTLELHGFKSFPNRTVLSFERGATVIVGPNGSGKSNISDAMRWVLGEVYSRNIRGTKMEDVIFGGTDDRRPMGFAEVSVTFDNTDPETRLDSEYDEVTVTRRYYRTGESEYLINRQPKRLRDIYELFMNTGVGREGYSIVGQGKIAEIISKKSEDRRNIFEEAAGISKYRHRKEESERKLKNVQINVDRVKDILTELESQIGPLERDAERARRGLAIQEEKKQADVSLWLFDTKKILEDIEEAERNRKLTAHELEIAEQSLADLSAQEETLFAKMQESKLVSARLLEEIKATTERLHNIDNRIRTADSDFAHSLERMADCRTRIAQIDTAADSLHTSRAGYVERAEKLEADMKTVQDERLEVLASRQKLLGEIEQIQRALNEAMDELTVEENGATDLKVRIDVLKNAQQSDSTKSVDIGQEIARYEEEGNVLREEAERCEKNAAGFREKIAEKDAVIGAADTRVGELTEERDQLTEQLNAQTLERDTYLQRADALQRMADHFEGYAGSVKFVMQEYGAGRIRDAGQIYGPLSSLITVEKQYITAIETALGTSLQNIVVDNENTAKAAIRALKVASAGRATFYPVSAIRPAGGMPELTEAEKYKGFVGRADKLVACDGTFRSVVEWLLLRTLVFDDIDNASVAAKALRYRVKIVTLDGQVISAGGAFTGGSSKRDSGILGRIGEIANMRERAEKLAVSIRRIEEALAEVTGELKEEQERGKQAEQEKEILLTLSRAQFAALDNANAKYEANRSVTEKLRADYGSLITHKSEAGEEIVRLTAEYRAAEERIAALRDMRTRRAAEMGVLDERGDEMAGQANDLLLRATEIRKDAENLRGTVATIDERLAELDNERAENEQKIHALEEKRTHLDADKQTGLEDYEAAERELKRLNEQRSETESGNDEYDRELQSVRARVKEKTAGRDVCYEASLRAENQCASLREKQDKLSSQLWDDYEMTYDDAVALHYPPVTPENREEVAAVQTSCRNRLRNIGAYDPAAIEKYAEVKMRYDDLNTQYTDLTNSQKELNDIIARLENEMRMSFITAFEAINKNFGITFRELFGGGRAELSLSEPEDVLTSGIEIKAAPPGKNINSMSLLSGGEQALVAIALLFAILRVNPTPFCILDEIEAALDEVNVDRFAAYVRNFDKNTQFILITHRRGTMEIGDRLYGVTMPQRGISQAIEVNVSEIEGKKEELLDGIL